MQLEPLTPEELAFLTKLERKDRSTYRKILLWLLALSVLFPFITSWYRLSDQGEVLFSKIKFALSFFVLTGISTISVFIAYRLFHRKLLLDIRRRQKVVSLHKITKKVAVAGGRSFHFYIDSMVKLSIKVSETDFINYREGDEICIEYAENSKQYFGYF